MTCTVEFAPLKTIAAQAHRHWVFVLSSVSRSVGSSDEILALFVDILHNKRLQDMATFMDKVKLFYKVKANVCLTSVR